MMTQRWDSVHSGMRGAAELYGFEDYQQQQPDAPYCIDTIYKRLVALVKESSSSVSSETKFSDTNPSGIKNARERRSGNEELTRSSSNGSSSSSSSSSSASGCGGESWRPDVDEARSDSGCSQDACSYHGPVLSASIPRRSNSHPCHVLHCRQQCLIGRVADRRSERRSASSCDCHGTVSRTAFDQRTSAVCSTQFSQLEFQKECKQDELGTNAELIRAITAIASTPIVESCGSRLPPSSAGGSAAQCIKTARSPTYSRVHSCSNASPAESLEVAAIRSSASNDNDSGGSSCPWPTAAQPKPAPRSADSVSIGQKEAGTAAEAVRVTTEPCCTHHSDQDVQTPAPSQLKSQLLPPPEAFSNQTHVDMAAKGTVQLRPKKQPAERQQLFRPPAVPGNGCGPAAEQRRSKGDAETVDTFTRDHDWPLTEGTGNAADAPVDVTVGQTHDDLSSPAADMFRERHLKAQSYDNLSTESTSMLLEIAFRLFGNGSDDDSASGISTTGHSSCRDGGRYSSRSSLFLNWDDDKMSDRNSNYRHSTHSSQYSRSPQSRSPITPCAPRNARLTVASETSLCVRFDCNNVVCNASALQYRVEWCSDASFQTLHGSIVVSHRSHTTEVEIRDLKQGARYHVRVVAVGDHGCCSPPVLTEPPFARPSSWREVFGIQSRTKGQLERLRELQSAYKEARPQLMEALSSPSDSPTHTRKAASARRGIRSLFSPPVKFQKNLKRGLYLASLLYSEDRVLVTSDEVLPVVEVDDGYPFGVGGALADFLWLVKVSCSWDVVHDLRRSVSKLAAASGALDLRLKLLQAAGKLQAALGVHDLGQLFYKPIRYGADIAVILTVSHVRDTKMVGGSSAKWLPLTKLHRHSAMSSSDGGADEGSGGACSSSSELKCVHADAIKQHLQDAIYYHRLSSFPLSRGLYLGFIKAISSVDDVKLLVSEQTPNVPPHVKLRGQPHVSKAEWQWLRNAAKPLGSRGELLEEAHRFKKLVTKGAGRLLENLGITKEEAMSYRLHTFEVLEFSPDVSFIIMMPPREQLCSVQISEPQAPTSAACKTNLFYIPMKIFETIHLSTYMKSYLQVYSDMACRVDMDALLSQQSMRQAFSSEELKAACWRVGELAVYQQQLEAIWQSVRWTTDVLTRGRERKPPAACGGGSGGAAAASAADGVGDLTYRCLLSADNGGAGCAAARASLVTSAVARPTMLGIPEQSTVDGLSGPGGGGHLSASSLTPRGGGGSDCDTDTGYHSDHSELNASAIPSSSDLLTAQQPRPSCRTVVPSMLRLSPQCYQPVPAAAAAVASECDQLPSEPRAATIDGIDLAAAARLSPSSSAVASLSQLDCDTCLASSSGGGYGGSSSAPAKEVLVYAAYDCGGAGRGSSAAVPAGSRTTARELTELVLQRLQWAAVVLSDADEIPNAGSSSDSAAAVAAAAAADPALYASVPSVSLVEDSGDYCLTSVVGCREHVLRDDSVLLQLKEPWSRGRLYVRRKDDLFAAIELATSSALQQPLLC